MKKPTIALCYDFDKTLSPKDMQEYGYLEKLNMKADDFWEERRLISEKHFSEQILTYMYLTMKKYREKNILLTRQDFIDNGKKIELFKGVEDWFKRINDFSDELGVNVEHYILSSGILPMIEGSKIAKEFKAIFACDFIYDEEGKPIWPAQAVNYTTKTQFLFRISKGILDIRDDSVNFPQKEKHVAFSNIIYIGDSATDIPCMRLAVKGGGHAIGVYDPNKPRPDQLLKLVETNRINFFAPADYSKNSLLDSIVKEIILKIKYSDSLNTHTIEQKKIAKKHLK
jgi:hypothetical protein